MDIPVVPETTQPIPPTPIVATKEELKKRLQQKIRTKQVRRITKEARMELLEAECAKAGIDPTKLIEQTGRDQKKRKN